MQASIPQSGPGWRHGVHGSVVCLVLALLLFRPFPTPTRAAAAAAAPTLCARETPQAVLECARAWQARGSRVPDSVLRPAVEQAFQATAPWEQLQAAVRAFDLYQERTWWPEVLQAFVRRQAAFLLLNADGFASLQRDWTLQAVTRASTQAPGITLKMLPTLVTLEPSWAKQLAATLAAAHPALVWPHAAALLAVDPTWAEGLLRQATRRYPYDAIRAVHLYLSFPWGPGLFTESVLREARWVVSTLSADAAFSPAVRQALAASPHPALRVLVQLAQSAYPEELKGKMAAFAEALAEQSLSFEAAARLSQDDEHYFQALVSARLTARDGQHHALDGALSHTASTLVFTLNDLFERPASVRFRLLAPLDARTLYVLLVYGEAEMFTSSYRGVFEHLLNRMQQEQLTGDQLLVQVHDLHFRAFIKAAAVANQLDRFLATIPAPVMRWSLLTRCLRDLERTPEAMQHAMTVAEMLGTPLQQDSLRLIRDTLRNEYARTTVAQEHQGSALYGLLIAMFAQRHSQALLDPALQAIAARYLPYLPDVTVIPMDALFPDGVGVQRYFFYNDDDGRQSFQSFVHHYRQSPWQSEDHGTFVHLQATGASRRLEIYANNPALDEAGNAALEEVLQARRVTPGMIVHRGHSLYIDQTLARLPPSVALIYLGNCGGYTLLQTILSQAPQAHIFTTKGIGGISVNDPLLKALNDYLLSDQALTWPHFWQHAASLLGKNPRFVDYVPPHKNTGAFFLQAYRRISAEDQSPRSAARLSGQTAQTGSRTLPAAWLRPMPAPQPLLCTAGACHTLSALETTCQAHGTRSDAASRRSELSSP